MGFSKSECKIHPSQLQNQGVCPSCLRERLSRLSSTSYIEASRASPYYASNSASPARRRLSHRRNGSEVMGSSSFMGKAGGLKKSKSIAFVLRKADDEDVQNWKMKKSKERKGFWSKLLRLKGKKMDAAMHSTSTSIRI
ncbi:hypothetical protein GQ457_02G009140 [Hibiscus cannabinus]